MEMTKKIHESGADEEAYSEYMREYNTNRHRKWFEESRVVPIEATRNQILRLNCDLQTNQEDGG